MNGDRKEIPTDKQEDGSISFDEGYGADYEKNKQVDPTAKDISRQEFNSVLHDITDAIGDIQRSGVATWTNEISYNKGATIIHNGAVYTSNINANKNEPPHASWSSLDLSVYRKKDDLLFNGMMQVQATDDVGTGVFLLDKEGNPRGQMTSNSGGLQFAQHGLDGTSRTYTLPDEAGELLTDVTFEELMKKHGGREFLISAYGDISTPQGAVDAFKLALADRKVKGTGVIVFDKNMTIGQQALIDINFDDCTLLIPEGVVVGVTAFRLNLPTTGRGYDGGYKNFYIIGNGTFKGEWANSVFYINAQHVQGIGCLGNVKFEETCVSHVFDLQGCSDFKFDGMEVIGSPRNHEEALTRHYIEFVQVSGITPDGSAFPDSLNPDHVDHIDTKIGYMRNCKFVPKYNPDGSIKSHPPRPIGNHSVTCGYPQKDIFVYNNKFIHIMPVRENESSRLKHATIAFPSADNIHVFDNEIVISPIGNRRSGVYFEQIAKGKYLAPNAPAGQFTLRDTIDRDLYCSMSNNIKVEGTGYTANSVLNIVSVENKDTPYSLTFKNSDKLDIKDSNLQALYVFIYGDTFINLHDCEYNVKNRVLGIPFSNATTASVDITVKGCYFKGSDFNSNPIVSSGTTGYSGYFSVNFVGNTFRDTKGAVRIDKAKGVFVGNTLANVQPVEVVGIQSQALVNFLGGDIRMIGNYADSIVNPPSNWIGSFVLNDVEVEQ